jgi:Rrf2 family cysteine metabolism transcriptional repressor
MSLQMSTRSRYGLRLMVFLASSYGNGIVLMKDVSRREEISEKYLGQIIIPLKNAGLVTSQRGSKGGYALARLPESITVKDVVEAIEGDLAPVPCVEDSEPCARKSSCIAARVWKKLADDMAASLSSFTLAELARQAREMGEPVPNYSI